MPSCPCELRTNVSYLNHWLIQGLKSIKRFRKQARPRQETRTAMVTFPRAHLEKQEMLMLKSVSAPLRSEVPSQHGVHSSRKDDCMFAVSHPRQRRTLHDKVVFVLHQLGTTPSTSVGVWGCSSSILDLGIRGRRVVSFTPQPRIFLPRRWRQHNPPKLRFSQDLHDATSQKTAFFMATSVKTSNATSGKYLYHAGVKQRPSYLYTVDISTQLKGNPVKFV
jgi:hypothetical protein